MPSFTRIGYSIDYVVENGLDKTAYGFVYITENLSNGKRYVGQRRFSYGWKNYLGSGKLLLKSVKKYGSDNFRRKIIEVANTVEELDKLEIFYIDMYNAPRNDMYYNIATGGHNGNPYAGKTEEEMKIIGDKVRHSGVEHPMYGRKHTAESKKKISESRKGKCAGVDNPWYGKTFPDGMRRKMSENHHDFSGENSPKAVKVICITTVEIFGAMTTAARFYNINSSGDITMCCRGKNKSAGKHPETGEKLVWMYYNDWIEMSKKERKEDI